MSFGGSLVKVEMANREKNRDKWGKPKGSVKLDRTSNSVEHGILINSKNYAG
jgi:hypothetical protein